MRDIDCSFEPDMLIVTVADCELLTENDSEYDWLEDNVVVLLVLIEKLKENEGVFVIVTEANDNVIFDEFDGEGEGTVTVEVWESVGVFLDGVPDSVSVRSVESENVKVGDFVMELSSVMELDSLNDCDSVVLIDIETL